MLVKFIIPRKQVKEELGVNSGESSFREPVKKDYGINRSPRNPLLCSRAHKVLWIQRQYHNIISAFMKKILYNISHIDIISYNVALYLNETRGTVLPLYLSQLCFDSLAQSLFMNRRSQL